MEIPQSLASGKDRIDRRICSILERFLFDEVVLGVIVLSLSLRRQNARQ
jgi:hypothetical protein